MSISDAESVPAALTIISRLAVYIRIDDRAPVMLLAKTPTVFPLAMGGYHRISAYASFNSTMLIWQDPEVYVTPDEMVQVEVPVGAGLLGTVSVDGKQHRTSNIFGVEWFAENYHKPNWGHFAWSDPHTTMLPLYIGDHAETSAPSGWRLPSRADFQTLMSYYDDPSVDMVLGGQSGFQGALAGFHRGKQVSTAEDLFNGYYWTSDRVGASDNQVLRLGHNTGWTTLERASHTFASLRYVRDRIITGQPVVGD